MKGLLGCCLVAALFTVPGTANANNAFIPSIGNCVHDKVRFLSVAHNYITMRSGNVYRMSDELTALQIARIRRDFVPGKAVEVCAFVGLGGSDQISLPFKPIVTTTTDSLGRRITHSTTSLRSWFAAALLTKWDDNIVNGRRQICGHFPTDYYHGKPIAYTFACKYVHAKP